MKGDYMKILFDIDSFLYTGLRLVLLALGVIVVLWVVFRVLNNMFGEQTTIEPADPQELLDSDYEMRDHALNEMLNTIYMTYNIEDGKAATHSYQNDLDRMVVKVAFDDVLFICTADWRLGKYIIDTTVFRAPTGAEPATVVFHKQKSFKMNENSYVIDYRRFMKFLKYVQDVSFKSLSFEEVISDAASIAQDPALKTLTPEQLEHLLYDAATMCSNLLNHRKWRRNRDFFLAYSMLMAYICANGKKENMIKYLKAENEEEV